MSLETELLYQVSLAARLADMRPPLKIDGTLLNFEDYPFIPAIIDCPAPRMTIIKGAQLGFTSAMVLRSIVKTYYRNLRGLLYLFPRDKDVTDFSRARFSRVLENPALKQLVKDTDSIGLKRIGDGFAYFRAASWDPTKEGIGSPGLKSVPVDELILDERDEMNDDAVEQALHRLDSSELVVDGLNGVAIDLSTPSIPGYGVDAEYDLSDQRVWMIKCQRCQEWTCLELAWPEALVKQGGDYVRACRRCRKEIFPRDGEWVPRVTDKPNSAGFWVSQLASVRRHPNVIMEEYETAVRKGKLREFTRSVLGRAYAEIDTALTKPFLEALCDAKVERQLKSEVPCAMGADAGSRDFHWITAQKMSESHARIVGFGVCREENELIALAQAFKVECLVIDEMAEARTIRRIKEALPGVAYGCHYTDQRGDLTWDVLDRVVRTNRTAALDQSHYHLTHGFYALPRADASFHDLLAPQIINLVRKLKERNRDVREDVAVWVPRGTKNDHLRHALNYLDLALTRVGVAARAEVPGGRRRRRGRFGYRGSYLAR